MIILTGIYQNGRDVRLNVITQFSIQQSQSSIDAAKLVGYNPATEDTNDKARYPRRSFVRSGYIMLPKSEDAKKSAIITTIAEKMSQKRNKQKTSQR